MLFRIVIDLLQRSNCKSEVVPYSITSIGLGADPGFLAVSLQVT